MSYVTTDTDTAKRQVHYLRTKDDVMTALGLKTLEHGVSAFRIETFCLLLGLTMYGLSLESNYGSFINVTPAELTKRKITRSHKGSVIFLMADQHFYPVDNKVWRTGIAEFAKDTIMMKCEYGKGEKKIADTRKVYINVPVKDIMSGKYNGCTLLYKQELSDLHLNLKQLVNFVSVFHQSLLIPCLLIATIDLLKLYLIFLLSIGRLHSLYVKILW